MKNSLRRGFRNKLPRILNPLKNSGYIACFNKKKNSTLRPHIVYELHKTLRVRKSVTKNGEISCLCLKSIFQFIA
jgi:hypothetical protein